MSHRPTHADIFMEIAEAVAKRSTCPRRHVGAVLVRDSRIIATGYNGSVPNALHCTDVGCLMVNDHCKRTIHAELNVILQCAREGISCKDAALYVTTAPCGECLKLLATAGIDGIFYLDGLYKPEFTIEQIFGLTTFEWFVQRFTYSQPQPTSYTWPEITGRE